MHPRCPFAIRGVDSAEMAACRGYAPEVVPVGAERIVGSGHSCRHLRPQRDPARRGAFVSACTHPVLGARVTANGSGGADEVLDLGGVPERVRHVADPGRPLE
jgi:hypothetical protein